MGDKQPKKTCLNVLAILAITLAFAITAVGCDANINLNINGYDDNNENDDENPTVVLSRVTFESSPSAQLTLTFNKTVLGLSASNITLSPGVTKGTFSRTSGTTYTLQISGFATGTLTVAVEKSGYTIIGSPKTVNISGGGGSPTVGSVMVNPTTANVSLGGTQQFSASVAGTGSPGQGVTWSIVETVVTGTSISISGLLTVAAGETATSLTVRATSTADTTKYGDATVTVTAPSDGTLTLTITFPIDDKADVTGTTTIAKATLLGGSTIALTAPSTLTGISWSIGGETISGSSISNDSGGTGNKLTIDNSTTFLHHFAGSSFVVNVQGTISSIPYSKSVTITLN